MKSYCVYNTWFKTTFIEDLLRLQYLVSNYIYWRAIVFSISGFKLHLLKRYFVFNIWFQTTFIKELFCFQYLVSNYFASLYLLHSVSLYLLHFPTLYLLHFPTLYLLHFPTLYLLHFAGLYLLHFALSDEMMNDDLSIFYIWLRFLKWKP